MGCKLRRAFMAASPIFPSVVSTSSRKTVARRRALCVLATALLWWFSLQRIGLFAFGWIAFVPLLCALSTLPSARERFWFGWRVGIFCFALINWWILPAIVKGGAVINVSPPVSALLGVLAVFLIGVIHGIGIAIIAILWNPRAKFFKRAPLVLPVFVAVLWFGFETVRSTGVLAHSWGAFAFSQWRDVALLQSASVIGQHGLSALCVWFAASLALWLQREYSTRAPILWRIPLLVFLLLHAWGAWRVWDYDNSDASDQLRVLLVQTDISSLRKNRDVGESHFDQAERLTRAYLRSISAANRLRTLDGSLVVWPETTATLAPRSNDLERAESLAREQVPLLFGAQVYETVPNGKTLLTNRAVLRFVNGRGQMFSGSSSKMRVVPFGERAPFGKYLPFLNQLAPEPAVEAALEARPLQLGWNNQREIGALICFESCFPDPARSLKNQGAKVLFVLTNDEWCAGTSAPWEHAAMSTLRAVENDVPVAQSANGGYSLGVDARGRFLKISDLGKAQVLEAVLPLTRND
jgi:apolipoprotein N-acyltransferase